jgi:hypothetical protein
MLRRPRFIYTRLDAQRVQLGLHQTATEHVLFFHWLDKLEMIP